VSGPWPAALGPGAATGVGSLPGTDPSAAQARVLDLLPDLPHLVELPARGPGADMVGRGAALLVELPVDLQPAGWRFVERPGRDLRRAHDLLARDLDALAEAADGYVGPLKVQACGPWTLAATVELQRGDKSLQDQGATAEIAASLAEGLTAHVEAVRRAVPGADVVVQLDEPALPLVIAGHLPTASGFGVLRVPETPELVDVLATVTRRIERVGVHCCAGHPPIALLRSAGATWIGVDATLPVDEEELGEAIEAGTGVVLGLDEIATAERLRHRLGLSEAWRTTVVLSPRCGLASSSDPWGTYERIRDDARRLAEQDDG